MPRSPGTVATDAVVCLHVPHARRAERREAQDLNEMAPRCSVTVVTLSEFGGICMFLLVLLAAPRHAPVFAVGFAAVLFAKVCARLRGLTVGAL